MEDQVVSKTTIAPNVLITIVKLTALATPGVTRLVDASPRAAGKAREPEGVKLFYRGDQITADVYIVISATENVRLVAEDVQHRVVRAISDMVGMEVVQVNVHVADVDIQG